MVASTRRIQNTYSCGRETFSRATRHEESLYLTLWLGTCWRAVWSATLTIWIFCQGEDILRIYFPRQGVDLLDKTLCPTERLCQKNHMFWSCIPPRNKCSHDLVLVQHILLFVLLLLLILYQYVEFVDALVLMLLFI